MTDNGGPAFPAWDPVNQQLNDGLSKREWFAGMIASADLANASAGNLATSNSVEQCLPLARLYYRMADAMIAAGKEVQS
jgi:hypothetical protein